ncbi:unnamed protein product [Effrenium voratum]|nr:unnamed protein product [Effrenium voratum]
MAGRFLLVLLAAHAVAQNFLNEDVGDTAQTCNVDAVQVANLRQLHPILHDLVNTTFFRLFRVNLRNPVCPYWKSTDSEPEKPGGTCTGSVPTGPLGKPSFLTKGGPGAGVSSLEPAQEGGCSVEADASSLDLAVDRKLTRQEQVAQLERDNETQDCEFEEDLPHYWMDMCSGDHAKGKELEDVNLIKNPERNTGYNGSHIWQAMYDENCFEVGSTMPRGRFGANEPMCYEERVLYRLLSGWHVSTSISIAKNFYAPGTKQKGAWSPNLERFYHDVGEHPERAKNLHFSFVVLLRAVRKAAPFLNTYAFNTGDEQEDAKTKMLMARLLDSRLLSLCSPLFEAFDETRLFRSNWNPEQRSQLKRQFKSVFRNVTELVDCVQCQRCRLHAKLFSLGLGTALKILLSPEDLIASTTSRDDVVAMVNVLWKLSDSLEDVRTMTKQYYEQQAPIVQPQPPQGPDTAPDLDNTDQPMPQGTRRQLLDLALRNVHKASATGQLPSEAEERLLRFLVAPGQASEEVLLMARHYSDRASTFCRIALFAAEAFESAGSVAAPQAKAKAAPADLVIVGGGLAGMSAAMALLDRGGSVVMVEKQPYLGGNSGKASSGINAALETTVESLVEDTTKSAGALVRPDLIQVLATESAEAVAWLRDRTKVDLSMRSQLGGHTAKRTLRPSNAFVGAELTFAAGQVLSKLAEQGSDFQLMLKSKWTGLRRLDSGVWEIDVQQNGATIQVQGRQLLIASGGFGHDAKELESLLLKYRPDLADFPTTLGPQTTGDGVKLARDLGAALVDMDRVQLHPTGFVDVKKPLENTKTLAAELLRGVGGLLLDRHGRRFTDELGTRQAVVNAELKADEAGLALPAPSPHRAFALVLNSKAAKMADRHVTLYSKKGLLTKAEGVQGLAERFGFKVDVVNATLMDYNAAAKQGIDAFGRKVFPEHWPIEASEDFYVGEVVPVIHYTMGGIAINTHGQVLDAQGKVMPGLYAAGEASGGVHGDNRLAGNSLLECTVFGRRIGMNLPIRQGQQAPKVPTASALDPAPEPEKAPLPKISQQELKKHRAEGDLWVALYGHVYDMTEYVWEHPGGSDAIFDVGGQDGTVTFETVHNKELLETMGFTPVGILE